MEAVFSTNCFSPFFLPDVGTSAEHTKLWHFFHFKTGTKQHEICFGSLQHLWLQGAACALVLEGICTLLLGLLLGLNCRECFPNPAVLKSARSVSPITQHSFPGDCVCLCVQLEDDGVNFPPPLCWHEKHQGTASHHGDDRNAKNHTNLRVKCLLASVRIMQRQDVKNGTHKMCHFLIRAELMEAIKYESKTTMEDLFSREEYENSLDLDMRSSGL